MRLLGLIALVTAAVALSACGGADTPAAPGTPHNPLVGKPTQDAPTGRSNEAAQTQSSDRPGYQKLVERQSSKPASRFTPCNLVSRAQARGILGGPVMAPVEAPQGPTCIYRSARGKALITLAVQSLDFRRLKKQMRRPQVLAVSKRAAFCGSYGQQMLYVSLAHKRVLSVAAPCPVAKQFAVRAVARLGG